MVLYKEQNTLESNLSELFSVSNGESKGNFDSKMVEPNYVSWRTMVRLLWNLPRTIHCNFLSTINSS